MDIFHADDGDAFGHRYLVEGVVNTVLAYPPVAPGETLGSGDLRSDADANDVVLLSWEHRLGVCIG